MQIVQNQEEVILGQGVPINMGIKRRLENRLFYKTIDGDIKHLKDFDLIQ